MTASWHVAGTYFESCNCDAICPCRSTEGAEGGRSTHGVCDFALSWRVEKGHHGDEKLDGLAVVMAGSYEDGERSTPWTVALLVDDRASMRAQSVLAEIFLGQAGGTPMANYTRAIGKVRSIRPARIRLDHRRGHERIDVEEAVEVEAGARPPTGPFRAASRATIIREPSCTPACFRLGKRGSSSATRASAASPRASTTAPTEGIGTADLGTRAPRLSRQRKRPMPAGPALEIRDMVRNLSDRPGADDLSWIAGATACRADC